MNEQKKDSGVQDCLFIALVVLVSSLPYIFKIGFYSDDWGYLPELAASKLGVIEAFRHYLPLEPSIRPVPLAYIIVASRLFGLHPLPYHIVNAVVLALVAAALYWVSREFRAGRLVALTVALVYALLPHYSTERVWISAHLVTMSMAFALFGIYAVARSTRAGGHSTLWVLGGVTSLLFSILSYEVALGLIVSSLVFIGLRTWLHRPERSRRSSAIRRVAPVLLVGLTLFLAGVIKASKQGRVVFHHHFYKHLGELIWHAITQLLRFDFWTYLLNLPAVLRGLHRHSAIGVGTVLVSSLVAISVAVYLWRRLGNAEIPSRRASTGMILLGAALFALGYAFFFADLGTNFSSAGMSNRFAMASALGAATVLVGIAALLCSFWNSRQVQTHTYAILVALICGVNCVVLNGIAHFWVDASAQQSAILSQLTKSMPEIPTRSVLLLDGFCRYSGPGIVFENDWDATGALQLAFRDPNLNADVVSPNLRFEDSAVETTMDGQPESRHPYANNLFVYNLKYGILKALPSADAARSYAKAVNPSLDSGCPAARDSDGDEIF